MLFSRAGLRLVLGDDMGQTTSAADSYRRLRASMLECVTVDMDTGGTVLFQDGADVSV